jgi:hypothetical protein
MIARGTFAAHDPRELTGAVVVGVLREASEQAARVVSLAPRSAARILASGDTLARTWARESAPLALAPPRAATVSRGTPAVYCPVNAVSCASAGCVSRPRAHDPARADRAAREMRRADSASARQAAGLPVARRTKRGKRGGKGVA